MDQYSKARAAMGAPLSLEASLEEENKEVLATLSSSGRSQSPTSKHARTATPPPYRSMLDVDSPAPRHGSIAGIGVGITSPRDQRRPSKRLDPADPSTWTLPHNTSAPTSPQNPDDSAANLQRGLPKIQVESKTGFEQSYNFDMASIPSPKMGALKNPPPARPRENSGGAMSAALRGELGDFTARRNSKESGAASPKSPPLAHRAATSNTGMLSPEKAGKKGRTLSGSTSDEGRRGLSSNKSGSFSTVTDESDVPSNRGRTGREEDEEALDESSDEEDRRYSSSDGDSPEDERGRSREVTPEQGENEEAVGATGTTGPDGKTVPPQVVRSLLDPEQSPSRPHPKSNEVHPESNFGRSGPTAADFADDDEYSADIRKAKTLGLSISPLDDSIPDRYVRMIIRGEWSKFQDDNENHNASPKLYLTCTDMSMEATYAMEWTVGTMLRDGDTLLAIYAIEDENAPKEPEGNTQVMVESAKAAHDASDAMETLTRRTTNAESQKSHTPNTKFIPAIEAPTLSGSMDTKNMTKKQTERLKALDEVTQNFLKLVRKTPLQIRCMVEVIHCKSPKHLILNAIDELEPTLCVVGTRGRSSLKGVLLGSFSNYLVTKSSVPVMVARKRLKKPQHAKVNSSSIRLSNNLTSSILPKGRRGLTQARID